MDSLLQNLPEIRYLYYHLNNRKRSNYVKYGSKALVDTLANVALNLVFSNKNGIKLSAAQIKTLKKQKKALMRLILAKTVETKRKLLTARVIDTILSIFMKIAKKLNLDK